MPTRVAYVTTTDAAASPRSTPTFDVQAGDVLVALVYAGNPNNRFGLPTWDGAGAWTQRQQLDTNGNYCALYLHTCVVTATATGRTVTVARTAGTQQWRLTVSVWRGASGIGAASGGYGNSAPSLPIATAAGSALTFGLADFDAGSLSAPRSYRAVNGAAPVEQAYAQVGGSGSYTLAEAYSLDTGPAGTQTVGLTAPSMPWTLAAVELLAAASAVTASSAVTLPALQSTGAATATAPAASAAVLPGLQSASTAATSIPAASAPLLPSPKAAGTATLVDPATIATVLPALQSAATAALTSIITLPYVVVEPPISTVPAASAVTLPALRSAVEAGLLVTGLGAVTFPRLDSAALTQLSVDVASELVLPSMHAAAELQLLVHADVATLLPALKGGAPVVAQERDITVTATLGPRRWAGSLEPRRWAGGLP